MTCLCLRGCLGRKSCVCLITRQFVIVVIIQLYFSIVVTISQPAETRVLCLNLGRRELVCALREGTLARDVVSGEGRFAGLRFDKCTEVAIGTRTNVIDAGDLCTVSIMWEEKTKERGRKREEQRRKQTRR